MGKGDDWILPGSRSARVVEVTPCTEHLGWLEPYQFTYPIDYVTRDIIATQSPNGDRPSVTVMEKPLFDRFTTIDLGKSSIAHIDRCLQPLTLEVPKTHMQPANASSMIFGLQTTMKRLKETVKHLARWLPHTGARLYALVIETEEIAANDEEMRALEKEFRNQGMKVSIVHPVRVNDTFAQRYFSLVNVMYAERDADTRWVTLIDDDTFFPSMHDLLDTLAKYDATKPQYIGALSEDWWAVNRYGLMGFGGAGIMLSVPMAKIIDDHTDECKENLRTTAGDISVMDCIYHFSSTKLTHIPELHQVDMHGDLSGFYESGQKILSLHHWKEGSAAGYKLEMEKMHLVADICDSCFLQRWQFPHEVVLSNGFSVCEYPQGHISGRKPGGVLGTGIDIGSIHEVEKIDLQRMEETWADEINVLHSLAPARPKLDGNAKLSYKLLDSMLVDSDLDNGRKGTVVRQVYFREGGEGERDKVMVLNWRTGVKPDQPGTAPEVQTIGGKEGDGGRPLAAHNI